MTKNTSFSLGDHFSGFVETQVEQGRYNSASDVVRAGLRLLEQQETTLAALRAALIEGENSGPSTRFDFEDLVARKRREASSMALPSELADFVTAKVASGRYASPGDVVREALRSLERVEQESTEKLAYLRKAWQDGIDSGEAEELDFGALKAEGRARLAASRKPE